MTTDLKNLTPEQKEAIVKEVNTELVSVASEELRTGQKITIPNAEELVARAALSITQGMKAASNLIATMSKKQINRAVLAMLAPPHADMPVYLKDDKEKMLFDIGQKVFYSKHVIFEHHVLVERQRIREQQEKKQKEQTSGESDESAVQKA